jgi:carboxylesterase
MSIIDRSTYLAGGGTGVLLIHGLGGTPVEMRYIAQGLHKAGYTVYCCQLTGHCGDTEDLIKAKWKDWIDDVSQATKKLKHCDKIFVGGLSAGSLLALYLASHMQDKIDGVLLYSPTFILNGWAMPWYMKYLHYIRPSMQYAEVMMKERHPHGLKDDRIRKMVVDSMQSNSTDAGTFKTPLSTMVQFNALSAYMRKNISNIKIPILSLHPRDDDFSNISNSYEIIKKVKGRVDLVVLEDSYHIITLDKQRQVVVDRSVSFIEKIKKDIEKHNDNVIYKNKFRKV